MVGDLIAILGAIGAAIPFAGGADVLLSASGMALLVAVPAAWLATSAAVRLDDPQREGTSERIVQESLRIACAWVVICWLCFVALETGVASAIEPRGLVVLWLVGTALLVAVRPAVRSAGGGRSRVVVAGAGTTTRLVAERIRRHPEYGLDLVGFLAADGSVTNEAGVALSGPTDDLPRLLGSLAIDRVIITCDVGHDPAEALQALTPLDVRVDVVPPHFRFLGPAPRLDAIEDIPVLAMASPAQGWRYRALKRALDAGVSGLALVVLAPVLLVVAVLVRLDSPGPALYRQRRLGHGMRPFTSLKFRSMKRDTSDAGHREYINRLMDDAEAAAVGGMFKAEQTASVTRIGRWLRRTSVDELPQLINVLRGDMSLVGPRPCIPYEVEHFNPTQLSRFLVPAGLTGLWQVRARARSTFAEALDLDVAYVRSASFGLDLRLLLGTLPAVLRRGGTR